MKEKKQANKIYGSKVFWAVVSLILSLILWSYISNIDGSSMEKTFSDIEVKFSGEAELLSESSLAITNVENNTVTVRIRGNRSVVGKLSSSDIKAVVDVSRITQPEDVSLTYDLEFPANVSKSDITVISRSPGTVSFTVVKNAVKNVPVKGSFEGRIVDGCVAEELVFDPEFIEVKGPESIVDTIDHAWVTFGKNEKIDSTYSVVTEFELQSVDGTPVPTDELVLSAETVNATQPINKTKEFSLAVNIIDGGGVTEEDCKISIEPQSISVLAESRLIEDKDSIILGTVDLASFQDNYEQTFAIELDEGIENLTGVTEAKVTITIPSVKVRTVSVSNISCKNCSEGYSATINTEAVEITLRSQNEEALNAVNAEDVEIVVDLADYGTTTGQIRANGTAYISGYENVGAVGEIKVLLTILKD